MLGLKAQKRLAQGVASLALGYVLLPFQGELSAALAKFETLITYYFNICSLIVIYSFYSLITLSLECNT